MTRRSGASALVVSAFSLLWLGAQSPSKANSVQDAGALIDQVVNAYGGKTALARVTAYRMEGTVLALMRGTEALTIRSFERPNRLRVEVRYPERTEVRILDGEEGWRTREGGEVISVEGFMYSAMVLQAIRANIPWILDEARQVATLMGPQRAGDRTLLGLEFVLIADGMVFRALIDPETSLVVHTQATLRSPRMSTHFETVYTDFREVGGVLFAFEEQNFASGQHTATTVITDITINPEFSDDEFVPPW